MRSLLAALALALVWAPAPAELGAQAAPKVLRVRAFAGSGLSPGETAAAQNLVTSYVVEYRSFRVIDAEGQELALREAETAVRLGVPTDLAPLAADYILSGSALEAGGLIVFTLDLTKASSGEKRSVSKTAGSVNDLILSLRSLTDELFERGRTAGEGPGQAPETAGGAASSAAQGAQAGLAPPIVQAPRLSMLTGAWSGDKGVDRVSIFRDGRGVAILSSGVSMRIRAKISGSTVIVSQDQASIPEFYKSPGLDLKAARAVAAEARPWRWIFSLSEDKSSLAGIKESVFVRMDAEGGISVDNNYVREASWVRLFQ